MGQHIGELKNKLVLSFVISITKEVYPVLEHMRKYFKK